jgi:hypothetical protein
VKELRNLRIFVIGSMSREEDIKKIAKEFERVGHEVDYVRSMPEVGPRKLIAYAYEKIFNTDRVVALEKREGGLGIGTMYEVEFAKFFGKDICILDGVFEEGETENDD